MYMCVFSWGCTTMMMRCILFRPAPSLAGTQPFCGKVISVLKAARATDEVFSPIQAACSSVGKFEPPVSIYTLSNFHTHIHTYVFT